MHASALSERYAPPAMTSARGIPFGLFTTGRRPELKKLSGQEKLPVLQLADGSTINGSGNIIAWARRSTRC
jgi:glutathione S-transferase